MNPSPITTIKENMKKLIGKILCKIGYHNWQWWLSEANNAGYRLDGTIPPFAKCSRCGEKYDK